MNCPNCKKEVSPEWNACPYCGYKPEKCPKPGCKSGWLPANALFCPECGTAINPSDPSSKSQPKAKPQQKPHKDPAPTISATNSNTPASSKSSSSSSNDGGFKVVVAVVIIILILAFAL